MNKLATKFFLVRLEKLESYLLTALFFSIPLLPKVTTILLICYFVCKLPQLVKKHFSTLFKSRPLLCFMGVYIVLLFGVIYSIDFENGLLKIQTQISFFIVPFFMGGKMLSGHHRKRLLLAYVFGVLLTVVLCAMNMVYRIFINEKLYVLDAFSRKQSIFFYKELSGFLDLHPTYFSIYLGVGLFCLLFISFGNTKKRKVFKGILIGLFLIFLFLTSSKGGIFSFVLVLAFFLIFDSLKKRNSLNHKIILVLSIGITIMLALNPILFKRSSQLISTINNNIYSNEHLNESSNIRFNLWDLSLKTYQDSPVWGFGTGSVYKILGEKCLNYHSFSTCETLRLKNSHNQYLNFLVSNGILAFVPFMIAIVLAFRVAFKSKDQVFILFMSFMALNFFFESLLQRERGVVFFMLFVTMFIMSNHSYEKRKA